MILRFALAFFTITVLLGSNLSAKDYMYFSVDSFWMKKEEVNTPLALYGDIAAKKMLLIFDSEEIEIDAPEGELFYAKVRMEDNRITFKKDYISFSTDMGLRNPLNGINEFDVKNSDIEFSKEGITINSTKMDLVMDKVNFGLRNISLVCENGDDYSTEIDDICLKKAYLRKLSLNGNDEDAFLSVKDLNSTFPLELKFNVKEFFVNEKNIQAETHTISGKVYDTHYDLQEADFNCFKFADQTTLDPERLLGGCFEESESQIKNFKLSKKDLDANIHNANMSITKEHFKLDSNIAEFTSGSEGAKKDKTTIKTIHVECLKKTSPKLDFNFERSMILEGCIEYAHVTVDKVQVDEGKALEFLKEVDFKRYDEVVNETKKLFNFMNFKDLRIKSLKGQFILQAKAKFLFRVPVKITGQLKFNKDIKILSMTVDKASVLGIPSKKLALYLVKKFVANDDIQIAGNTINVQF